MKFGHYWPKDPASERIEHLRPYVPRFETFYSSMTVLKFEPFSVGKPKEEYVRDTAAAAVHEVLFGSPRTRWPQATQEVRLRT